MCVWQCYALVEHDQPPIGPTSNPSRNDAFGNPDEHACHRARRALSLSVGTYDASRLAGHSRSNCASFPHARVHRSATARRAAPCVAVTVAATPTGGEPTKADACRATSSDFRLA
jgi:hypothetical protein